MEKPVKSHVHIVVKKAFSVTNRKNSSFKRILSKPLHMYALDAIAFWNMVSSRCHQSTKHYFLCTGVRARKKAQIKIKKKLERNFENCATNLVKMNYRLASVFFVRAFWKCSNLHNFHRAFDQAWPGWGWFSAFLFSQKRSFAGTFKYCFWK